MNIDYLSDINMESLLQGRYEKTYLCKDYSPELRSPDFFHNILNRSGLLYRPIRDEINIANGQNKPEWPSGASFAVCLTHDVDSVSSTCIKHYARRTINAIRCRKKVESKELLKNLTVYATHVSKSLWRLGKPDPIHCYEKWLEIEKDFGAKSTFFFLPQRYGKCHKTNKGYRYSDAVIFCGKRCTVAGMMREMDRKGWEIGLHSSWYSFDDANELKYQKEQIEEVLGHTISSIRQHYLHYNMLKTPLAHFEAGFKYDSTLGFNDNIGFRFGTCYPWNLYDLENEKELDILEIPLIIQDGAIIKKMGLDEQTALTYAKEIIRKVEEVSGVLTLLWHPDLIMTPKYFNIYKRILEYLSLKKPWFATISSLGDYWLKKNGKQS